MWSNGTVYVQKTVRTGTRCQGIVGCYGNLGDGSRVCRDQGIARERDTELCLLRCDVLVKSFSLFYRVHHLFEIPS